MHPEDAPQIRSAYQYHHAGGLFFGEVRNVAQIIVVENFIFVVLKRVAYINQLLIIISHGEQFFFICKSCKLKSLLTLS